MPDRIATAGRARVGAGAGEGRPPAAATRRVAAAVLVGFGAALLAICAVGGLGLRRVAAAEEARASVEHTHEVLDALAAVRATTEGAVAEARGAALTGAVPNQAALGALAARADTLVSRVALLTRDNGAQQARLPALHRHTAAHFAALRRAAASAAAGHDVRGLLTPPALAAGDSVEEVVASMRAAERVLLAARGAREQAATMRARTQVAAGAGGAVVVCLAVLTLLWNDAGRRQRAECERTALWDRMQDAHEELEVQNEELVEQSEELGRQSDALHAARDYLEAVLAHMSDGVVAFDEQGRVILCNPAAQAFLGLPHVAVPVEDWPAYAVWREASGGEGLDGAETPVARVRGGGTVCDRELVLAPAGARERVVVANGRPVRDRSGRARGAILALHDVTDRQTAERLKSELVSIVSHELRTPLTAIHGALRLLEANVHGALPDRAQRIVALGRANSDRMIRLVDDLLDLERLDAGRLDLEDEPLDPAVLVNSAVVGLENAAAARSVRIETEVTVPSGITVRGDRGRLVQVLTSLLSNAIKFSPHEGRVSVHVDQSPTGEVRLGVRDMGPGIAEPDVVRLFQRFQQIDSSDTRNHGGAGLGLALAKNLIERHGGRIGVESRPGYGSHFWIELPR